MYFYTHVMVPVLAVMLMCLAAQPAEVGEGAFGHALDARQGALVTPGCERYGHAPLTVACRVKLLGKDQYNILVAQETKASALHWELFTTPGDGVLHVYVPGRAPDHVHTARVITDSAWHWVFMVMENARIRLFVDGEQVADEASTIVNTTRVPGALVLGGLVEGGFGCNGLIDEVRIGAGQLPADLNPGTELGVDADTLALWRFREGATGKEDSGQGRDGELRAPGAVFAPGGAEIAGGMPTILQPLPEPEDAAPLRAALLNVAAQLSLKTIAAGDIDDAVLRQWSHDFIWEGKKEYPESRPGGPDEEKLRCETYDRHALVWETDGGPLGTALRRLDALLESPGGAPAGDALAADVRVLKQASLNEALPPDADAYKARYLAACALRRQVMLRHPLLDFEDILCVVRGTFEGSVRSNPETADAQGGHFVTQYFGFNALPGGGLYIIKNYKNRPEIVNVLEHAVVQNGRLKGRKLDYGAFATPALSYDGRTIAFAWTENAEHRWIYSKKKCFHLFRVNVDGSDLVQLTDGPFNDFDPCWLPDGRIAFISERRGGYIRCFAAYLKVRTYTLFSMTADGGDIRPMSYFETSEWNPSVNNEGQLVYTRWDYVDRENCLGTRFWISNPDGSNPRAPHGNYPHPYHTFPDHTPWRVDANGREWDSRWGAPMVEMGIRAVPGSPLYIFTAAPHHGSVYGSLGMLDLRVEDDGHM